MANKGWICIHRQIEDSAIWKVEEPFDKRSAWIDLILMANHEAKEIFVNGCPLVIRRGQKFTSIRKLCDKWGWSRHKVERFLEMLNSSGMVRTDGTHNGTLITIVKYEDFQTPWDTKGDTGGLSKGTRRGHGRPTNNKCNTLLINESNEKEAPPDTDPWGNELQ